MNSKIITSQELGNFVNNIIQNNIKTYGVEEKSGGKFHYAELKDAGDLRLDYDVTLTPPKMYLSPAVETLFKFKIGKETKTSAIFNTDKRVIIGVHPYDMIAINQMDEVWKDKNEDANYLKRRKNTVIIGVDPESASSRSFWSFIDASTVDKGYDIWLTKLEGGRYFVETKTEAGDEFLKKYATTSAASKDDLKKRDQIRSKLRTLCNADRKLNARPDEIPLLAKNNFSHQTWKDRAKKCYSCGSCNIVCPTCYCFDVKDEIELNLEDGRRVRIWDGCQLEDFAKVGSGENFREERADRFKHRFFRKALYQFEKYGYLACVGCGRCSSACLPDIADPVDIINTLKEGK